VSAVVGLFISYWSPTSPVKLEAGGWLILTSASVMVGALSQCNFWDKISSIAFKSFHK